MNKIFPLFAGMALLAGVSAANAHESISTVPASTLSGLEICKAGYTPPQCMSAQFDIPQDLAFQANGCAKPAVARDTIPGYDTLHKPEFANDGFYGNGSSWISDSDNSWIKIDLGKAVLIDRITFGRDRLGYYDDRDPGQFTLATARFDTIYTNGDDSNDANEYTPVFDSTTASFNGIIDFSQTLQVNFTPLRARFIKLTVASAGTAIDEIEVFSSARKIHWRHSTGYECKDGRKSHWQKPENQTTGQSDGSKRVY